MVKIVGIQFQSHGKAFDYILGELQANLGDYVIAETGHGLELGQIAAFREMEEEGTANLPKLARIATEEDIRCASEMRTREQEAFRICQKKIQEHRLEMKLVSVEYAFEGNKILFYFTANGRVDFRSLVKDLASVFRTRIELRQIGVRDEARMLGGLGPCGRQICCGAFLKEFQPVSIRMAKDQNLSLNPTKISGVCGRLMCCLKYEQDHYEQTRKKMPRMGREVNTPSGVGTVCDLNIVKETVSVRIMNGDSSEIREFPLEQISRPEGGRPAQAKAPEEVTEEAPEIMETAEEILLSEAEDVMDAVIEINEEDFAELEIPPRENPAPVRKPPRPKKQPPKAQLGQPVKRENPNRPEASGSAAKEEGKHPRGDRKGSGRGGRASGKPAQPRLPNDDRAPMQAQGKRPQKKQNWAEAVRNAMESMEQ